MCVVINVNIIEKTRIYNVLKKRQKKKIKK